MCTNPPLSPAAVARRLKLSLRQVRVALARLEAAGLVSRHPEDWGF